MRRHRQFGALGAGFGAVVVVGGLMASLGVASRVRAWVRTKDLSTNEGVAFNVVGQDGPGPNFTTEPLLGSTDWKLLEHQFVAPSGTSLVLIRLTRKPSLKFDNLIRGTLWVDQVAIRRE